MHGKNMKIILLNCAYLFFYLSTDFYTINLSSITTNFHAVFVTVIVNTEGNFVLIP